MQFGECAWAEENDPGTHHQPLYWGLPASIQDVFANFANGMMLYTQGL
jgi:hypothetical protein